MQGITNLIVRAKELAIQAANDTFGAQDREALALELLEMKEEMLSAANAADSSGAFIFGAITQERNLLKKIAKEI